MSSDRKKQISLWMTIYIYIYIYIYILSLILNTIYKVKLATLVKGDMANYYIYIYIYTHTHTHVIKPEAQSKSYESWRKINKQ